MRLWDKLGRLSSYVRTLRHSRDRDSYFQYRIGREQERRRADDDRDRASDSAERRRGEAERARAYDERYEAERERDAARERSKRPEETGPDR